MPTRSRPRPIWPIPGNVKRLSHQLRSTSGFTVIEVLVAMTVLLVGVAGALSLMNMANATTARTAAREAGTSLARELTESVRGISYDKLTDASVLTELQTQPGLADSDPGGQYTLVRRNVVFEITTAVCVMDDTSDGARAVTTPGTYCTGSAVPGSGTRVDRNPEDYKRVAMTLRWERNGYARSTTQTAIVNNPGAAGGPSIRSISSPQFPTPSPLTSPVSNVELQFLTSMPAETVNWMLDGTVQSPVPTPDGAKTLWTAFWNIDSVVDGTYVVSAEAYDEYNVSGSTRQITYQLNRFVPVKPTGVTGGRNLFEDVEIEWAANLERDIVGYEVRRVTPSGDVVVTGCTRLEIKLKTYCRDTDPPDKSLGPQQYKVVAFDSDNFGQPREGNLSDPITVIADNLAPYPPVAVVPGSAGVTLTWSKPSPDDPGPLGDSVNYYRIYRDGKTYNHRHARWFDSGSTMNWTDPNPDGTSHTYYVTSVDTHYMESPFSPGVTVP